MENQKQIASRRVQFTTLQSRIALHGNRMWQLPLTYLATIVVTFSGAGKSDIGIPLTWIFIALAMLGLILTWCLYGAYEGYSRTANNMNELEEELGMGVYTRNYISDSMPYFLLMIFGIITCLVAAIY